MSRCKYSFALLALLFITCFDLKTQTYASLPYSTDFSGTGQNLSGEWTGTNNGGRIKRKSWASDYYWVSSGSGGSGKNLTFYAHSTYSSEKNPTADLHLDLSNTGSIEIAYDVVDNSSIGIFDILTISVSVDGGSNFTQVYQDVLHVSPHSDRYWNGQSVTVVFDDYGLTATSTSVIRFSANVLTQYVHGGSSTPWASTGHLVALDGLNVTQLTFLPVEFTEWECSDGNLLKWQTASEVNGDRFEVEHSIDASNWKQVGTVACTNNLGQLTNYSFKPNLRGYYRIKQVDNDSSFIYTNVVLCGTQIKRKVVGYYNALGQKVRRDTKGIVFILYSDGLVEKRLLSK